MSLKPSQTFLLILLAIFFGALSGILGFIIIGAGNFRIPLLGTINYANPNLDNRIVIDQPRSVTLTQDTQTQQIENDLLPAVINIYSTKKTIDPATSAYTDSEILGHGFVLTADGWAMTVKSALDNLKGNYTAVGYQNKKYILSNLLEDKASGVVFTKMAGVNLPVARLGQSGDLHLGQTVVVVAGRDQLLLTNISKIGYDFKASKDLVLNSDYFHKRIYLVNQFGPDFDGALLVNFKGEVVGIISDGSAIPIDYFSNVVSQVLNKQKIVRAALGVDYLDLAQVDGLIDLSDKGAYVVYEPLKGAAAFGQIKKGDLIKKVNDAELNAFNGLADAINGYNMGDIVELLISRAGKDLNVKVTLK